MNTYKMLVLTDHSTHTSQNSIYELVDHLRRSPHCQYIDIASRGLHQNKAFFFDFTDPQVYVRRVDQSFAFRENGRDFGPDRKAALSEYDVIFLRIPHPIPKGFWPFLLQHYPERQIINRPSGIHKAGSKDFLLNFPELCPPMKLCHTVADILTFKAKFPIVLKPLKSFGGKGIVKIDGQQVSVEGKEISFSEFLATLGRDFEPFLGMKFLKNVDQGDKRIIVVNGKIIGASLRKPPPDSWLCNASQGGLAVDAQIDDAEIDIAKGLATTMQEQGVVMYGFDTLVNDDGKRVLSEINTMSIGGLVQMQQLSGKPVVKKAADLIWEFVNNEMYGDDANDN